MKLDVRPLRMEVLDARIAAFEERYGVPSHRMAEAFTVAGVFRETEDFRDWWTAYAARQAAGSAQTL